MPMRSEKRSRTRCLRYKSKSCLYLLVNIFCRQIYFYSNYRSFHLLYLNRQQEKLKKIMNATGYQEKVPSHIQEENVAKLAKLMQEFEFFEKESVRLDEMK